MAVVGTLAVNQIEFKRQPLLRVILRPNILLLIRTIRTRPLARIVDPAHQVIEIRFLTHARQVRGKCSALRLVAFTDRVASQASTRLEQIFSVRSISLLLLGKWIV